MQPLKNKPADAAMAAAFSVVAGHPGRPGVMTMPAASKTQTETEVVRSAHGLLRVTYAALPDGSTITDVLAKMVELAPPFKDDADKALAALNAMLTVPAPAPAPAHLAAPAPAPAPAPTPAPPSPGGGDSSDGNQLVDTLGRVIFLQERLREAEIHMSTQHRENLYINNQNQALQAQLAERDAQLAAAQAQLAAFQTRPTVDEFVQTLFSQQISTSFSVWATVNVVRNGGYKLTDNELVTLVKSFGNVINAVEKNGKKTDFIKIKKTADDGRGHGRGRGLGHGRGRGHGHGRGHGGRGGRGRGHGGHGHGGHGGHGHGPGGRGPCRYGDACTRFAAGTCAFEHSVIVTDDSGGGADAVVNRFDEDPVENGSDDDLFGDDVDDEDDVDDDDEDDGDGNEDDVAGADDVAGTDINEVD